MLCRRPTFAGCFAPLPLLLGVLLLALVPRPTSAAVRSYFSQTGANSMCEMTTLITTCAFTNPLKYHSSFFVLRNPQSVITVQPTPGAARLIAIQDVGLGAVTLHQLVIDAGAAGRTTNAEGTFGPGAILFFRGKSSTFTATPQGPFTGSTSAGGQIDWGLVTGFDAAGEQYCASGNGTLCSIIARSEDMSVAAFANSATYDLGTWTFDASGHFTSPPYISGTLLGGTANTIFVMNGGFIDNALPALPLIGFAALAAALIAIGARSAMHRGHRS